ncbi:MULTISPECIES: SIS domain-containing protein [Pseudofrankia]|uniref:SIS domain-containing protein n=1 Tax=Pseudofrankia TaxID=2994363 RepID=UPI000234D59D|nr:MULTISPECIES: SIS domain-containing protein [Pseudofrankia]OHV31907.1 sugar isomerase [Pseudofrankia sp. EUN1h]
MTETTSHIGREIARQPRAWARACELLPQVADLLPQPGERVAVLGCGTSWFMAAAYAALRESAGAGETDAFAAGQWPAARRYDRVVAISRSGTTTEVLRAIDTAAAPVTVLTGVADSPAALDAEAAIVLDFADETSVVQTVFATTALTLLRASLGDSVEAAAVQAARILAGEHGLAPEVETASQFTFLGSGWGVGVASEAALKMREAARVWTESYPQLEYRHGPISIAEPGRVVWIFGEPVPGLVGDIEGTGATIVNDDLDPVADLVRVQRLAAALGRRHGLDPDRPRNLTRSVILSPATATSPASVASSAGTASPAVAAP